VIGHEDWNSLFYTEGDLVKCRSCREGQGTWEAPDEVKGDIARMLFSMVVRYEGNDMSNTPDLELLDSVTDRGKPHLGKLCTLYQWHIIDPVSDFEENRNNVVYSWQGNRNPFIDRPEYAEVIWRMKCSKKE
jgi:endonuclease I